MPGWSHPPLAGLGCPEFVATSRHVLISPLSQLPLFSLLFFSFPSSASLDPLASRIYLAFPSFVSHLVISTSFPSPKLFTPTASRTRPSGCRCFPYVFVCAESPCYGHVVGVAVEDFHSLTQETNSLAWEMVQRCSEGKNTETKVITVFSEWSKSCHLSKV